jgi:serpin B
MSIGAVAHKAFIDVNEDGTEAAAATATVVFGATFETSIVFRADHPFVFLVRDNRTRAVLFLGRLAAPPR